MTTNQNLLIRALFLAITAPDETKSKVCVSMADDLAAGMTSAQVEICKRHAEKSARAACDRFITEKSKLN